MSTIPFETLASAVPPLAVPSFDAQQPETVRLYPLSNYTFGTKEAQPEEDPSVKDRLRRLEQHYQNHGMRRACEAVLLCHEHNHPHVLMLQIANAFFKLPGDHIPAAADELSGLKARLDERLAPTGALLSNNNNSSSTDWNITHTLAQWWRPTFDTSLYPYLPAHVTRPKECRKMYFVQLPSARVLAVPKNMKLLAVPLFELYENPQRYGPQLSAIPHALSRFRWEFVDEDGAVVACTPGAASQASPPQTRVLAGSGGEEKIVNGSNFAMDDAAEQQPNGK